MITGEKNMKENFFVPICNLYYDEALKGLKAREFQTYMTITYLVKSIGPNTTQYFFNKQKILASIQKLVKISQTTFLKHFKTLENIGLITKETSICFNLGYDIAASKEMGFI